MIYRQIVLLPKSIHLRNSKFESGRYLSIAVCRYQEQKSGSDTSKSETATDQAKFSEELNAAEYKLSQLSAPPQQKDNPHFIDRWIARFKGQPLKGEREGYKTTFHNIGREWLPPKPIPPMQKDFKEYPERDLENYPYPTRFMFAPKTRMLMFPDSWFTAFYNVTGVSGPYFILFGTFAFLLNKEYLVMDDQFIWMGYIIFTYLLISRGYGYRFNESNYKYLTGKIDRIKNIIKGEMEEIKTIREEAKKKRETDSLVRQNFPLILEENMNLQLEAAYRTNVEKVANEMKRRLDYLQEIQSTKQRFAKEQMLKWILNSVWEDVRTNKDSIKDRFLENSIEQLRLLAPK